jgi:hypothetical protein
MTIYDNTDRTPASSIPPPLAPVDPRTLVIEPVHHAVVADSVQQHTRATTRRWAFDSVICGIIGVAFAIVGLIAMSRAGMDAPLSDPAVEVLGFGHTALLGLIEVGVGVALLIAAAMASRGAAIFLGTVLGIASFVAAIEAERLDDRLGVESGFAWLSFIMAIVIVVTAMLVPRVTSRTTTFDVE